VYLIIGKKWELFTAKAQRAQRKRYWTQTNTDKKDFVIQIYPCSNKGGDVN